MNTATIQRDQAVKLARSNQDKALKVANRIEDPWFKTQALASIAACANDGSWESIADRALRAAQHDTDPYRIVGASAWALSVLVKRNSQQKAKRALGRSLEESVRIANTGSRCDALLLLYEAVFTLASERDRVLTELLAVADSGGSWRCGKSVQDALLMLASVDSDQAKETAERIRDDKSRRRTLKKLSEGIAYSPRKFHFA